MEAVVSFWLLVLLMKLKSVILTTNFHLIRVNTRNSTVQTSKSSSALLQVITHMKQFFKLFKGFTEVSSKPETVDALKQNTESASEELSSPIHFSKIRVFSGLSLKSSIFFHIKGHLSILEILDAEKRLEVWKLKKTYFRETVNKETRKCLLHSKRWVSKLCVRHLSRCSKQQILKPLLEHWPPWTFWFAFCLPTPKEERFLDSVSRLKCYLNWNLLKLSKGSVLQRLTKGDANFGQGSKWIL